MSDYSKLKALAEGSKSAFEALCESGGDALSEAWHKAEEEFDNECSAQVVLELIADFESTAYDHDLLRGEFDQLKAENEALRRDAKRYRFLRNQHWPVAYLAVVVNPKISVKLGHDCPSGDRLDDQVDGAMKREASHD